MSVLEYRVGDYKGGTFVANTFNDVVKVQRAVGIAPALCDALFLLEFT